MKIKKEHLEYMREKIAPFDNPSEREQYKASGFTSKRYRWDLLHFAGLTPWLCNTLYREGLNDDHIDTALRVIVKDL